jgi:hypothetical protein
MRDGPLPDGYARAVYAAAGRAARTVHRRSIASSPYVFRYAHILTRILEANSRRCSRPDMRAFGATVHRELARMQSANCPNSDTDLLALNHGWLTERARQLFVRYEDGA